MSKEQKGKKSKKQLANEQKKQLAIGKKATGKREITKGQILDSATFLPVVVFLFASLHLLPSGFIC